MLAKLTSTYVAQSATTTFHISEKKKKKLWRAPSSLRSNNLYKETERFHEVWF